MVAQHVDRHIIVWSGRIRARGRKSFLVECNDLLGEVIAKSCLEWFVFDQVRLVKEIPGVRTEAMSGDTTLIQVKHVLRQPRLAIGIEIYPDTVCQHAILPEQRPTVHVKRLQRPDISISRGANCRSASDILAKTLTVGARAHCLSRHIPGLFVPSLHRAPEAPC